MMNNLILIYTDNFKTSLLDLLFRNKDGNVYFTETNLEVLYVFIR